MGPPLLNMRANAPGTHRSYLLDSLMLCEIANGGLPAAQAIWPQYAPEMYSHGPLPGQMQHLSGIAVGSSTNK